MNLRSMRSPIACLWPSFHLTEETIVQHVKGATNDRAQTAMSQAVRALPAKPAGVLGVVLGLVFV